MCLSGNARACPYWRNRSDSDPLSQLKCRWCSRMRFGGACARRRVRQLHREFAFSLSNRHCYSRTDTSNLFAKSSIFETFRIGAQSCIRVFIGHALCEQLCNRSCANHDTYDKTHTLQPQRKNYEVAFPVNLLASAS